MRSGETRQAEDYRGRLLLALDAAAADSALGSPEFRQAMAALQSGETSECVETIPVHLDWRTVRLRLQARSLIGSFKGILLSRLDITETKLAEEALREQEGYLRSILSSSRHLGVLVVADDGANRFSPKPVDWPELYRDMATLSNANLVPRSAADAGTKDSVELDKLELSGVDLASALKIWGDLDIFLTTLGKTIAKYETLVQDLSELQARASQSELIEYLHALKGTFGNLGCTALYKTAYLAEDQVKGGQLVLGGLTDNLAELFKAIVADHALLAEHQQAGSGEGVALDLLDVPQAIACLEKLADSLAVAELDEAALEQCRGALPAEMFLPLEDAINEFEFQQAHHLASDLMTTLRSAVDDVPDDDLDTEVRVQLEHLVVALEAFEIDDEALARLSEQLPKHRFQPLNELVAEFDFEKAIKLISQWLESP